MARRRGRELKGTARRRGREFKGTARRRGREFSYGAAHPEGRRGGVGADLNAWTVIQILSYSPTL